MLCILYIVIIRIQAYNVIKIKEGTTKEDKDMYKMVVTFESGKTLTYEKNMIDVMITKARILENEEKRDKLGMTTDKAVDFEIIKL